jgi:hypothetical protein
MFVESMLISHNNKQGWSQLPYCFVTHFVTLSFAHSKVRVSYCNFYNISGSFFSLFWSEFGYLLLNFVLRVFLPVILIVFTYRINNKVILLISFKTIHDQAITISVRLLVAKLLLGISWDQIITLCRLSCEDSGNMLHTLVDRPFM